MKNTFVLSVVIVICSTLICAAILFKPISSQPTQWRYQVVNSDFNDGKWLDAFGDKGWEAVTTTTDSYHNVQILFKKPK